MNIWLTMQRKKPQCISAKLYMLIVKQIKTKNNNFLSNKTKKPLYNISLVYEHIKILSFISLCIKAYFV